MEKSNTFKKENYIEKAVTTKYNICIFKIKKW